jgi:Ser/Thr protein kinase RdoA (MazF antagonist)
VPPEAVPAADLPRGDVERRVRAELGWRVAGWTELGTGTNNRLFRIDLADGPPLLAKFYARDRWDRLGTEFPALVLLAGRGVAGVPRPYVRSDEHRYGVYSFEPGARRTAAELTEADARAAGALAGALHGFGPEGEGRVLGPANAACFSVADQVRLIDWRVGAYEAVAADPAGCAEVRAFAGELDLRAAVNRLVVAATAGLPEDALTAALPRAEWRLTSYDFGPHNLLFDHGRVTAVDFEGAGWDDPARMVMGCVSHIGSEGMSATAVGAFLGAYAEARGLTEAEAARFERVGVLYDVEWAATYASALAPEVVETKRFGTPGFDLSAYLTACIAGVRRRLARAERGGAYGFPPMRR